MLVDFGKEYCIFQYFKIKLQGGLDVWNFLCSVNMNNLKVFSVLLFIASLSRSRGWRGTRWVLSVLCVYFLPIMENIACNK